ncbi:nitrogenase molybdenum-iron cofactor biosynthesis protein NifN [Sulfuricurvum kujiense DSM 16994]|uniref:Nitrogenase iron-molybdenum cofactor biosynthesis protein NifN n=1 Tax=Sulfuricurvum kujiense (strain ATCC BAA-921 / DSM 16994 / JCM 11577 / YK-1) TaxID=709032 RepID=E4TY40_SULKY|nr:nitrogenase iron-molybdenum cofactor biosynthesis protein NifN [Sulfuricurvum kujiense]ADR33960.1 nitrogenase molybdenum-iron cofactor biosynthesis protein NifN [Sulfuricurvum kujiense DSM 16994]
MEFSLSHHERKPLQVNPIKHSQPMGATLAFLGVKDCMALMHGAQGCASYTKVFFTRHFNEPIAVRNTSVSDITAVLDGGDYSILMAIENIQSKEKNLKPSMIGLHTTGLTETKGDDVRGVGMHIEIPYVFVNTPDYEGGMESGWALTVAAMIEQITAESTEVRANKLVLLPHLSMQPIEVEKIKCFCEDFGFETYALPDLSTSLDGYWEEGQGKLANGGITVDQIRELATSSVVVSIGTSMKKSAQALLKKNPSIEHLHFDHMMGLDGCDNFVAALMKIRHTEPKPLVKRWRSRLQDAMLDSHFLIGSSHFVVTGEPDMLVGICALLRSVGGTVVAAVSTTFSDALHLIEADNVFVGDLEDARRFFDEADMVISNFHAERILHSVEHTALVIRGFPNYEELGNQLKNDQLYEGSTYFLFEIANELRKVKHEH